MKIYHGGFDRFSIHPGQFWGTTPSTSAQHADGRGDVMLLTEADIAPGARIEETEFGPGGPPADEIDQIINDARTRGFDLISFHEIGSNPPTTTYLVVNTDAIYDPDTVSMNDATDDEFYAIREGVGTFPERLARQNLRREPTKIYHGREEEFAAHPGQFWATSPDRSSYYAGPDGFITQASIPNNAVIKNMGYAFGDRYIDIPQLVEGGRDDLADLLVFPETTDGEDASTYILVDPKAVVVEHTTPVRLAANISGHAVSDNRNVPADENSIVMAILDGTGRYEYSSLSDTTEAQVGTKYTYGEIQQMVETGDFQGENPERIADSVGFFLDALQSDIDEGYAAERGDYAESVVAVGILEKLFESINPEAVDDRTAPTRAHQSELVHDAVREYKSAKDTGLPRDAEYRGMQQPKTHQKRGRGGYDFRGR